jgi:prephenate dehydrogenase
LAAVREAQGSLGEVADAIERGDADGLAHWIAAAAAARGEAIATAHRAEPGDLHEILVDVPDRPGAIAAIAQAVSAAGIGIREFSLSHISTASGGEIRLIVGGADETTSAVEVLRAAGYSATAEALTPAEGAS